MKSRSTIRKNFILKAVVISLFIMAMTSFAAQNYIVESPDGTTLDVTELIRFLVGAVSKGMSDFIDSCMPLLASLAVLDYAIAYVGLARSRPREVVMVSIQKFLKYGCIYFLVTNWFGGINLSMQITEMITGTLANEIAGVGADENSMISTILAVITRNLTYLWEAPFTMITNGNVAEFLGFMAFAIPYTIALMILSISAIVIVGELLTETMNVIIMVAFSAMFFIIGMVNAFGGKLMNPLKTIVAVFIKYITVYWLYNLLWSVIHKVVESIKIPEGYTDFDPMLMLKAMWCAAVVLFSLVIFKLLTFSMMKTLDSLARLD